MAVGISAETVKELAWECGFELAGVTAARPLDDYGRFEEWRRQGNAGGMAYLTDCRGDLRSDPRNLLPEAESIVCVGKLYNTGDPGPNGANDLSQAQISRYARGTDYHEVLRADLNWLVEAIAGRHPEPFQSRICVDTAPLLERSYARMAGLGWIGKNACLINQQKGSWFFLGEVLLSIPLTPDAPPPNRCGSCTRCIDACPTGAIVPWGEDGWTLDARLCISYLTIEERGSIPVDLANKFENLIFGCDNCQDVCPWNRRAPMTEDERFVSTTNTTVLAQMSEMTAEEFRAEFRHSPIWRAKYAGFLRNVAIAMGNSRDLTLRPALAKLAQHPDPLVAETALSAMPEGWRETP